ncbi:nucleoside hydrolase [Erwinia sp. 9145]|uniref:nucleoside hydrolase n=1 Tax=Erwinia sp. 9145 TaxID=1500895 RepID=UPI00054FBBD5|nr:nucleoside hydrolase [Erwinia sp. 9145]
MKRIIIDCDPGNGIAGANVDDGLALAVALGSPGIALELITIVAGNTPAEVGFNVAKDLIDRLGLAVPVLKGAGQALVEPHGPWREALDNRVHSSGLSHLWNGVRQPQRFTAPAKTAADAIGERICASPGEITLVALGPLTNVALALERYPAMAEAVQEIAIMGGVFALDDFIKDTNFGLDPEAAKAVLNSGANITLVPMDVTTQTLLTHADLDRIASLETPLSRYVVETLRPWLDYSMHTRRLSGCWIHDALVVAWLMNQQIATAADYFVDVEIRPGQTRGKSWRYRPPLRVNIGIEAPAGGPIHVLKTVDNARLLSLIEYALAG